MRRASLTASLSVLALALACGDDQVAAPVDAAPPVIVAPVSVVELEERVEATGELQARNQAVIAAEVAGRITRIRIDEGQPAEAGEILLEIDPERRELELASARAQITEARAAVREARRSFDRVAQLHEREIASEARLDDARTALERAEAQLAAARAGLGLAERAREDSSVAAPFAGRVARRHVSRGEFVNVGQPLIHLVALDPVEVEFHLAERDSSRVEVGQEVLVRVDPHPDELFGGEVTVVSPTIDPQSRMLRVLARLENREGKLRPGLFARVDLGVALRDDVVMVPEEAVLQRSGGAVVYRLRPGDRVERVAIETGVHRDGLVEIRKGLGPTDVVATRGQASLIDGARIAPRGIDGSPVRSELAGAPHEVTTP